MDESEQIQKLIYDRIAILYEEGSTDEWSLKYREKYIHNQMTDGINLSQKLVLEAMCGSGQTANHLLSKGATVTGLDISSRCIALFKKKYPNCNALCVSILDSKLEDSTFDCVVVMGGLHHLQPNVEQAIDEIHRILKPDGYFCFMEPHSGSIFDLIRKIWYKFDKMFGENESSINVENLKKKNAHRFKFIKTKYWGNIAYLFVFNAYVFRIPPKWKRFYAPFLMKVEHLICRLQSKLHTCFVISQWEKRG